MGGMVLRAYSTDGLYVTAHPPYCRTECSATQCSTETDRTSIHSPYYLDSTDVSCACYAAASTDDSYDASSSSPGLASKAVTWNCMLRYLPTRRYAVHSTATAYRTVCIRARYAGSPARGPGTDGCTGYAMLGTKACNGYAMRSTDLGTGYAMPGTDLLYAATSFAKPA
eukprot:1718201-Rhodomonas_salina.1